MLSDSWLALLEDEFKKTYMIELKKILLAEKKKYKVYPPSKDMFNAFNLTSFDKVRVVILGQDPYHGVGQAHGLCFSVNKDIPIPPSLGNIYQELKNDLNISIPPHGCLTKWAEQGVFLLNTVLTVRAHAAGSHRNMGWEQFTDKIIHLLNEKTNALIFLLWGKDAKSKEVLIDSSKHLILTASHQVPSRRIEAFSDVHTSRKLINI